MNPDKRKKNYRWLKTLTYFILFNAFVAAWLMNKLSTEKLVRYRMALFTKQVKSEQLLEYNKTDGLKKFGFKEFKPKYLEQLENKEMLRINFLATHFLDSCKRIVLHIAKDGHVNDCGVKSDDLIENIKWIARGNGNGCCSDYAQAFMAFCHSNGIRVREVSNKNHTFNEVYSFADEKWIWIDPLNCLLAQSQDGNYLSSLEIFHHYYKNKTFNYIFFGNKKHKLYGREILPLFEAALGKEAFEALLITNGNNIFETNHWNQKFRVFPKSARQFILISVNIQPGYLLYDPGNKLWPEIRQHQKIISRFLLVLLFCNVLIISWPWLLKKIRLLK